jgi:hypothetical protein
MAFGEGRKEGFMITHFFLKFFFIQVYLLIRRFHTDTNGNESLLMSSNSNLYSEAMSLIPSGTILGLSTGASQHCFQQLSIDE